MSVEVSEFFADLELYVFDEVVFAKRHRNAVKDLVLTFDLTLVFTSILNDDAALFA